jgi:hypothetical protein
LRIFAELRIFAKLSEHARQAKAQSNGPREKSMLTTELGLMIVYRLLALLVAVMMAVVVWREHDWRPQLFAALVFVPFILRAAGVK